MCGITGIFLSTDQAALSRDLMKILPVMNDALTHRGPDDQGLWFDKDQGIGLGHRRLSILDLSPLGRQPMPSASHRYHIVFNGEIYNFQELTNDLTARGHKFNGHSDTEVMLAAIEEWGLDVAIQKFIGMFAFALWDSQKQELFLVRDRLGVKPLYWTMQKGGLYFASEMKAFYALQDEIDIKTDPHHLGQFLRYGFLPRDATICQNIFKLLPGHILTIKKNHDLKIEPYWTLANVMAQNPVQEESPDLWEEGKSLLHDAIQKRMVADVPLGAFLSGGIDSSTVVAIMQAHSATPVKTFTIGFSQKDYNEAEHAKAIAQHLGTDHTELYINEKDVFDVLPNLPQIYDEPFADMSQLPTFLVSRMARQSVTVALSGDGGDELFGGYNRHHYLPKISEKLGWTPSFLRGAAAWGMTRFSPRFWDQALRVLPSSLRYPQQGEKLHKLAQILPFHSEQDLYHRAVSLMMRPQKFYKGKETPASYPWYEGRDMLTRLQYADLQFYLPDDIMVKVDRASMANGLEAREPLLDHRLLAFAMRLPASMKYQNGRGKVFLRRILDDYVPRELIDRPKQGFALPMDEWLRSGLKDWGEELLQNLPEDLFAKGAIMTLWQAHQKGRLNAQYPLWNLISFQLWREYWKIN